MFRFLIVVVAVVVVFIWMYQKYRWTDSKWFSATESFQKQLVNTKMSQRNEKWKYSVFFLFYFQLHQQTQFYTFHWNNPMDSTHWTANIDVVSSSFNTNASNLCWVMWTFFIWNSCCLWKRIQPKKEEMLPVQTRKKNSINYFLK